MKEGCLGIAFTLLVLSGCGGQSTSVDEAADHVFVGGKIYTVNEAQPWAEAVAVKGNKIVYVGSAAGVAAYQGEETEVSDLAGKMLLPGFVSGHDHLVASNWTKAGVNLFPAKSKEEYLALIKEHAEAHPDDEFLYGYGWNYTTYGARPTAADLDSVAPEHKAIMFDFTIHDAWLNTAMLEAGGIDKNTKDKQPGFSYWERDKDGNPTGNAIELAWFPAYINSGAWNREVLVKQSQKELYDRAASQGWTSVVNIGLVTPNISIIDKNVEEYEYAMKLLKKLEDSGQLKLRTFMHYIYKNGEGDVDQLVADTLRFREQYDSDMLRMAGIKIHPEANWGTHTSLMLEGYTDKPDYKGIRGISADRVQEVFLKANAKNIDVSVHVDGSATIRSTIDGIEASREAGHTEERNSLQHFAVVHPDDMKRMAQMQIPVNLTPIWRTDWGNSYQLALNKLGEHRAHNYYQMLRIAIDSGTKVSISADVPSTPSREAGALLQLEAAIRQVDPGNPDSKPFPPPSEAITLEQGIKALTIDPAWQTRMEDKLGSIEIGKYADLVILGANLFDVEPEEIADVKVVATMMDGKYTFQAQNEVSQGGRDSEDARVASMSLPRLSCCGMPHPAREQRGDARGDS